MFGADVLLEGVVVEVLVAVGEVRAGHARGRAGAVEVVLDPDLALLRAEAAGDPVELGVALDARVVRREVPRLLRVGSGRRRTRASRPARRRARRRRSSSPTARARADEYSSTSVNRAPASATTSSRQKSEPPSAEFAIRTYSGCSSTTPFGRGRAGRAATSAALCAVNFSSQPTSSSSRSCASVERLEADPLGRALDLDPALGDDGQTGHVQIEHRLGGTCPGV